MWQFYIGKIGGSFTYKRLVLGIDRDSHAKCVHGTRPQHVFKMVCVCVCVVSTHTMPHLWRPEDNFRESVLSFHLTEAESLLLSKVHCTPGWPAHQLPGNSLISTFHIATRVLGLQVYTTSASGSLCFHLPSYLPGTSSESFKCSLGIQSLIYFAST